MKVCTTGGAEKPVAEFRKFGRGLRKVCIECEGGGKAVTKKSTSEPVPVTLAGPKLEILAGFGFRASIEDDYLMIEQDAGAGAEARFDSITLSKTEARVLFAQFHGWVHT